MHRPVSTLVAAQPTTSKALPRSHRQQTAYPTSADSLYSFLDIFSIQVRESAPVHAVEVGGHEDAGAARRADLAQALHLARVVDLQQATVASHTIYTDCHSASLYPHIYCLQAAQSVTRQQGLPHKLR